MCSNKMIFEILANKWHCIDTHFLFFFWTKYPRWQCQEAKSTWLVSLPPVFLCYDTSKHLESSLCFDASGRNYQSARQTAVAWRLVGCGGECIASLTPQNVWEYLRRRRWTKTLFFLYSICCCWCPYQYGSEYRMTQWQLSNITCQLTPNEAFAKCRNRDHREGAFRQHTCLNGIPK